MVRYRCWRLAAVMVIGLPATLLGQDVAGNGMVSVAVSPPRFESWNQEAQAPTNLRLNEASGSGSAKWWGLGIGAGTGAGLGIVAAQGTCSDNDSCAGPTVAFALIGALVGGVIGIFVASAFD